MQQEVLARGSSGGSSLAGFTGQGFPDVDEAEDVKGRKPLPNVMVDLPVMNKPPA